MRVSLSSLDAGDTQGNDTQGSFFFLFFLIYHLFISIERIERFFETCDRRGDFVILISF